MNQATAGHGPQEWSEAKQRAETYLRALRLRLGPLDQQLLARSLSAARERYALEPSEHPVTLVMESLFSLLPASEFAATPIAMTPPIQRVSMIPEPTEFPLRAGIRRLFSGQLIPFAGLR